MAVRMTMAQIRGMSVLFVVGMSVPVVVRVPVLVVMIMTLVMIVAVRAPRAGYRHRAALAAVDLKINNPVATIVKYRPRHLSHASRYHDRRAGQAYPVPGPLASIHHGRPLEMTLK